MAPWRLGGESLFGSSLLGSDGSSDEREGDGHDREDDERAGRAHDGGDDGGDADAVGNADDATGATGDPDDADDDAWTSAHGVEPIAEERAFAAGWTAEDVVDFADRHYRPSRWGRVDLSLSWTRSVTIRGAPEPAAYRVDEIWLRAVWRL